MRDARHRRPGLRNFSVLNVLWNGIQRLWTAVPQEARPDMDRQGGWARKGRLGCPPSRCQCRSCCRCVLMSLLPAALLLALCCLSCRPGRSSGGGGPAGVCSHGHSCLPPAARPRGGQAAAVLGSEGGRRAGQLSNGSSRLLAGAAGGAPERSPGAGAAVAKGRSRGRQRGGAGRGSAWQGCARRCTPAGRLPGGRYLRGSAAGELEGGGGGCGGCLHGWMVLPLPTSLREQAAIFVFHTP